MSEEEIVDLETINNVLSDNEELKVFAINEKIAKEKEGLKKIDEIITAIENENSLSGIEAIMEDKKNKKFLKTFEVKIKK